MNTESKPYYLYIMTSARNGALYVGVTCDLMARVREHKTPRAKFTQSKSPDFILNRRASRTVRDDNYSMDKLVYFERHDDIHGAIHQERRICEWQRAWQKNLVEKTNPNWDDLYDGIIGAQPDDAVVAPRMDDDIVGPISDDVPLCETVRDTCVIANKSVD